MTVAELAKLKGVTADVVRYYARIGLLKPSRNTGNNYKQFDQADANRVRFIRRVQRLGFTLAEIAEVIETSRHGKTPCPMVRETVRRHLEETNRTLAELTDLQHRMQSALAQWETMPDKMPDGHAICALIEAMEKM